MTTLRLQKTLLMASCALVGVFCLAPQAHAQRTTNFILVQQGIITATTTVLGSSMSQYDVHIGTGWVGTTTGAFVSGNFSYPINYNTALRIVILDNTTATSCGWDSYGHASSEFTNGFYQLDTHFSSSCADPALHPNDDYTLNIGYFVSGYIAGAPVNTTGWSVGNTGATSPMAIPQFAIVGNGFTLTPDYASLATSTCSITNLTGCFQNALVWAFYPPAGSLDIVTGLWPTISAKPPFGYFTVTQDSISGIGASTTPTFALEQVAGITQYIFDPLDEALAAIWWAIFGVWFFFNRVRHLQI